MSIKHKFASSGFWMVVASAFSTLSSAIVFFVLARLLGPAEFGIVAFASIFIEIAKTVVNAGIPEALIQRPEWTERSASTAFWTNLGISVALAALFTAVGMPLGSAFYQADLGPILAVMALIPVFGGLSAVHIAKLSREFRHRAIAWTSMICNLVGGVLGIAMAYWGWGVWALVVSRVFTAVILAATYWVLAAWRPRFLFSIEDLRSFLGFSAYLFGSQLIGQTNNQATAFIVGAFLGPAALGQYQVGFRAFNLIIGMLIQPLQSAALPAFSRLDSDAAAVGRAYLRMTALCGLVACPVFLGSSAIAYDFVLLVFGPQWADAGAVMALAGLAVAPATHMYFFMPALAARGKTRPAFWGMFVNAAGNIVAALATVVLGVAAVAAGQSARAHITLPFTLYLLKIGAGVRPIDAIAALAPPFVAGSIMALVLAGVGYGAFPDMSPWLRMGLMVVAGPVVYAPVLALIAPRWLRSTLADAASLLPDKFRRGPFARPA